jgi:hypothetical protein
MTFTDVSNALLILFAATIFTLICESYIQQRDIERYRAYTRGLLCACKYLVIVVSRMQPPERVDNHIYALYQDAINIIDEIDRDAAVH